MLYCIYYVLRMRRSIFVESGQKVKINFKDDFTSGTVDRVLFVSKQAAIYATAKVIVNLSNNSTCEVQFRYMYL